MSFEIIEEKLNMAIKIKDEKIIFDKELLVDFFPLCVIEFIEYEVNSANKQDFKITYNDTLSLIITAAFNYFLSNLIEVLLKIGHQELCKNHKYYDFVKLFCSE